MELEAVEDGLAVRRARRSTAGNRMQWAMAELATQPDIEVGDDDLDFVNEQEEEDEFEEDFASTGEEDEHLDFNEQVVIEEEKRAKQAHAKKLVKARSAASKSFGLHTRKKKVDVLARPQSQRQSSRKNNILNTSVSVIGLGGNDGRPADPATNISKNQKPTQDPYKSQNDLIKLALDMEESNVASHANYLRLEEAKRTQATTIHRNHIKGPRLRWLSKSERIPLRHLSDQNSAWTGSPHHFHDMPSTVRFIPEGDQSTSAVDRAPVASLPNPHPIHSNTISRDSTDLANNLTNNSPIPAKSSIQYNTMQNWQTNSMTHLSSVTPESMKSGIPYVYYAGYYYSPHPEIQDARPGKHAVNYVQIRTIDDETISDPDSQMPPIRGKFRRMNKLRRGKPKLSMTWEEHMSNLFGAHADWGNMRVIVRHRPPETCPISGRRAKYRDPTSGVPFASAAAYRALSSLLAHRFTWDAELGCYTGCIESKPPSV